MATLAKRATPTQAAMLKMVAGAVIDARNAHPEIILPETFARSVAKRAVGTLSAVHSWPEVLAAPKGQPSRTASAAVSAPRRHQRRRLQRLVKRGLAAYNGRQTPLQKMWCRVSAMIAPDRVRGENCEALIGVLVALDRAIKAGAAEEMVP